jgi:hypothetical protein
MPTGSFDLSPVPGGIATIAIPIGVALYTPGDENPYTILPNVRCLRVDYREGPEPPLARFAYILDDLIDGALGWPSQFERLWPIDAQGDYVVKTDDRLVVLAEIPSSTGDGSPQTIVLFDGFAQVPQVDVDDDRQSVTFVAQGVAIRLWDTPILGRVQRDADKTSTTDMSGDFFVDLPCRFNPADSSIGTNGGYVGNSVAASDFTSDPDIGDYPVFVEPLIVEAHVAETNYWFISDAIKYLIGVEQSPLDDAENPYVIYPTLDSLDDVLGTYAPPDDGPLNADAPLTNVKIRDYDASNKMVPDVMAELFRYGGFVMVFEVVTAEGGTPETHLRIKRRDGLATTAPKLLYLAADGAETLDVTANNATSLHLARDMNEIVNEWDVETALQQFEITVYLAPLFTPVSGDGDAAHVVNFLKANLAKVTDQTRRMYRWYGADECGDGHYNQATSTFVTDMICDFDAVFPPNEDSDQTTWVARYRPGSRTLISRDASGNPLKAVLELSRGGVSNDPKIMTEADTQVWSVIPGGWKLLDDRLGIEVTSENPEMWQTEQSKLISAVEAVPTIRGVTWAANPDPTHNAAILLRLTTVVEADVVIGTARAAKRQASPTKFTRRRRADGKDHFQFCAISTNSLYYSTQKDIDGASGDGSNPLVVRDDTAAAKTHAEQLRAAHEFPTLAGSATIPFLTDYYQIGDRIKIVQGRNASLQINVGVDQGEAPTYPWITAFAWDFTGDAQRTILQFSDRRAEPQGV